jgi:hypothetical protein
MSNQPPGPAQQNNFNFSGGEFQGKILAFGSNNQNVNLEINVQGKDVLPLLEELLAFKRQFEQAGFKADIATAALPTAQVTSVVHPIDGKGGVSPRPAADPSASLHGIRLAPLPVQPEKVDQLAKNAPVLDQLFRKIDQMAGPRAQAVQEIEVGSKRVRLVDLALQQGNLALWRFRRAYARLFGQQTMAIFLAQAEWPAPPEFQAFTSQARSNLDVLRGFLLFYMVAPQRPQVAMHVINQLEQGRWRQVLDDWAARKVFDDEAIQSTRTELEAIGEPYRPEEVRSALREAEGHFSEALKRDPRNTAALVNLGTLKAESATFFYIETGHPDRAALQQAQTLFSQARDLLKQRADKESRVALGKCLFYSAIALPPQAALESVQWAALQSRLTQASFSQQAQRTVNWGVFQRNLARRSPDFFNTASINEARPLFFDAGETALADQCAQMLQGFEQFRAMLPQRLPLMQAALPVVGSWRYQGRSMLAVMNGVLVFDSEGLIHWMADMQGVMGAQRVVCVGGYQVMGNGIAVQGQRWNMPFPYVGMPTMPAPFVDQMMIQSNTGAQLVLMTQQEGMQFFCQRM